MVLPSKHEILKKSPLIIGSDILKILKRGPAHTEELYQVMRKKRDIALDTYHDTLTMLWLYDLVKLDNYSIVINRDDSQETVL